jgi:hypothetical protein
MKEKEITVSGLINLIESVERENIQYRSWELAQLFGVYESAIIANVKAVIKTGLVVPCTNCAVRQVGNTLLPEEYKLELIVALAFRLNSAASLRFRKWIIEKISRKVNVFGINYQMLN